MRRAVHEEQSHPPGRQREIRADAIITRNQKDYKKSAIPVFDCDEFFNWMQRTYNVEYESLSM